MRRAAALAVVALLASTASAEPVSDHVEHKVYAVRAVSAVARVGEPAQFEVTVEIHAGYHLNDEYPIHFTPAPTPNVRFGKARYDGMKRSGCSEAGHDCRASLPIDFTAQTPGALHLGGELAFSACSDAQCLIEKINVAAPVTVSR
jgi:hypothetical protein